jgi:hypothetical protein
MATEVITVTNYESDRFARLELELQKQLNLKFSGDSGEVKDFGADVVYSYDVATKTLTLNVLHGPHFKNFDDFVAKLKAYVEAQQ